MAQAKDQRHLNVFQTGYYSLPKVGGENTRENYRLKPEDQLTAFFAYLLRADGMLRRAWFKRISGLSVKDFEIEIQKSIKGVGVLDLLFVAPEMTILCEVKFGDHAALSSDQVERYPKLVKRRNAKGQHWRVMVLSDYHPTKLDAFKAAAGEDYLLPKSELDYFQWSDVYRTLKALKASKNATLNMLRNDFMMHLDNLRSGIPSFDVGTYRWKLLYEELDVRKTIWEKQIHRPFGNAHAEVLADMGLAVTGWRAGVGAQMRITHKGKGAFAKAGGYEFRLLPGPTGRDPSRYEVHVIWNDESMRDPLWQALDGKRFGGLKCEAYGAGRDSVITFDVDALLGKSDQEEKVCAHIGKVLIPLMKGIDDFISKA